MYNHIKNVSSNFKSDYFNYDFETHAIQFLKDYDQKIVVPRYDAVMHEILNHNFSLDEMIYSIQTLKNGKCPGTDFFPAEFVKAGIFTLAPF